MELVKQIMRLSEESARVTTHTNGAAFHKKAAEKENRRPVSDAHARASDAHAKALEAAKAVEAGTMSEKEYFVFATKANKATSAAYTSEETFTASPRSNITIPSGEHDDTDSSGHRT